MASAGPAAPAVAPASSFENPNGNKARFADKLPEEINEMKIKDEKEIEAAVVDGNGTETGHIIVTTIGGRNGQPKQTVSYMAERVVGQGSFGIVFQAKCLETGETVAIKKVLQDKRYKNRELQTMRLLDHPNVVALKHCFFSTTDKDELYLNLVLEYVPETVYRVAKHYSKANQRMPMIYVKLYTYQICRALAYIHGGIGVCHRDIKPQNLLVNPHTHQVKLCDFGSAKVLVKGEPNISYICSRYYRAPELIFGATEYTTAIDIWSVGCVLAELLLGQSKYTALVTILGSSGNCKDCIGSALETIRPTTSWERTTAVGQGVDGVLMGGRGFEVAIEALLNYLGSEYGSTFALGRVFAFLSGPPDYGAGQLDTRRYGEQYASRGEDADRALLPEQTPFYKDLAAVAVQAGVCVDIFAVTNEYTDLASLKFLSVESGGSLYFYSNTDDSTLPQDMYRMLSRPYAFGCVLRLRTSSEFKTGHSYGHFFPDPQYENVQHIICCDSYATYAYDFEFEATKEFSKHGSEPPIIQIAFQYTVVLPPEELTNSGLVSSVRGKHSLKRRLRIRTLQCGVAQNMNELYDSVDPEVVLSLLVHKVILASLEQGVREGRLLLHDWLVILTAQYNEAYKIVHYKNGSSVTAQIDVAFSQCPELQPLPRLVFALLRNPLLLFHEEGVHPDYRIYLQCLFSALEPSSLHRAVYPVLTSYSTPDKLAYPRHSLSRAALITSGSPIFFLDAFTALIVFYSSTADPTLPFPPPHDCLLRTEINRLKQERCITPKLIFIRGGQDDATAFENYLIEEQDVDGSGITSVMGFVSFLEDITQSVLEYIKS